MDEEQYRATYHVVNERRCVFEKALNSRVCACECAQRFNLADREGVACRALAAQAQCQSLLDKFRETARFALHLKQVTGPLPHASEIKVQNGGLLGLQTVLTSIASTPVANVHGLVSEAIKKYGDLDGLPYGRIVQSMVHFEMRRRRPNRS